MQMRDLIELCASLLGLLAVTLGVLVIGGLGLALIVGGALAVLAAELNDLGRRR